MSIGLKSTVYTHGNFNIYHPKFIFESVTISSPHLFESIVQYFANETSVWHRDSFPHWKSYKVTNSSHPYPKIKNSKCNSFMSTYVKMSTSCTPLKTMSISWRYFRNIFESFIGHFCLRLYSNFFADDEDDSGSRGCWSMTQWGQFLVSISFKLAACFRSRALHCTSKASCFFISHSRSI